MSTRPAKRLTWNLIEGGPKQRDGRWDPASNACVVEVRFTSEGVKYRTLNLDTITTIVENGQIIRKRAKGTILAELKKDPPCYSGEATPAMPPAK